MPVQPSYQPFSQPPQMLQSNGQTLMPPQPPHQQLGQQPQQATVSTGQTFVPVQFPYSPNQQFGQTMPRTPSSAQSVLRSPAQVPQENSTPEDHGFGDALLYVYRNNMGPQFPFVVIPDDVSAVELAQKKPFLYRTVIMAASYHDRTGQSRMTKDIFQYLSKHMIIRNEKSMDLLQGLLVLMAWSVCPS